ncbi:helix-turn-helix transcriptional regulator [Marinobacter sp. GH_1]|uniref:helix-turn-helix transcriptional regulator n=1 Tax=Marinobacter sp. GH_1 TaxID=3402164 RepID=UPI003B43C0AE
MEPRLLNTEQAAIYIGLAKQTITEMRVKGGGPKFCKIGRAVRYKREDLDAWIDQFESVGSLAEHHVSSTEA